MPSMPTHKKGIGLVYGRSSRQQNGNNVLYLSVSVAVFYLLMKVRLIFHDQKGERIRPGANRRSLFDIEVIGTGLWSR